MNQRCIRKLHKQVLNCFWWKSSHISSTFCAMIFEMALPLYETMFRSKSKRVKTWDGEISVHLILDVPWSKHGGMRLFQIFYLLYNVSVTRIFEYWEKFTKEMVIPLNFRIAL